MRVTFTVLGTPIPQGSKTRTRWGMREDNPKTRPWRDTVAYDARAAMGGEPPLVGPLWLDVTFWMPRPKSHYGSGRNANALKATAPDHCTTKPDLDKLLRALGDAMTTAGVWMDDSQAVVVEARKMYVDTVVTSPGCAVVVLDRNPRTGMPLGRATMRALSSEVAA